MRADCFLWTLALLAAFNGLMGGVGSGDGPTPESEDTIFFNARLLWTLALLDVANWDIGGVMGGVGSGDGPTPESEDIVLFNAGLLRMPALLDAAGVVSYTTSMKVDVYIYMLQKL